MSDDFDVSEAIDTMQKARERKQKEKEQLLQQLEEALGK
jgi:hypothetical protein